MSRALTFSLTLLAMIAFAGNSLLCRLALKHSSIDAASFTTIRIVSGALALWLILRLRAGTRQPEAGRRHWRCLPMQAASPMPTSVCPQRRAPCCSLARYRQP